MYQKLNRAQTENLLSTAGAFTSECTLEMSLSLFPQYYRIYGAYQFTFKEQVESFAEELAGLSHPVLPEGLAVLVLFEMTDCVSIRQMEAVRAWAGDTFGAQRIVHFVPACYYSGDFATRFTLVFLAAKSRRRPFSSIHKEYCFLKETEHRIAKKLDEELKRNEQVGTVHAIEEHVVADLMYKHHFLWTGISNSNTSAEEVIDKLRPEMKRIMAEYDVSGMMLFVEVDSAFTRGGEIRNLIDSLRDIVGRQETDIGFNLRTRDSYTKYITCRAALIGNPKYICGEIHEDLGKLEILLYVSDDCERGHEILASYEDGRFTLFRYDWGAYEFNRMGKTDDQHYFDEENTKKLFSSLHVKNPRAFLRTLRKRFASRLPSMADEALLGYCRKAGIMFESDYHY